MLLEGMHLPLTTPFFADGRLNLRKLEQNAVRYSLTPASGIVVLGPSGEANLLTDNETRDTLRVAIGAAAATKVMLAGVVLSGVSAALERIEATASLGYDAVIVCAPRGAGREQRVFLQSVADRAALPVVLTGEVETDLLVEIAARPNVLGYLHDFRTGEEVELLRRRTAGVKRTVTVTPLFAAVTGRMLASQPAVGPGTVLSVESLTAGGTALASAPAKSALRTRTKEVGFQMLAGGTERMLPCLLAGAVGVVPPFATAAPQACYEVLAAWKDGDPALAEEKQARVIGAARTIEGEFGVAGLKYGCDLNGYFGGTPRLPLLPLLREQKAEVERLMHGLS